MPKILRMERITNDHGIKFQRTMMTIVGAWPKETPSFIYKLWGVFNCFLAFTSCVMLIHSLFFLADFSQLIENWNMCIVYLVYWVKLACFYGKRSTVLAMLNFLNDSIFHSHDPDLDKHLQFSVKLTNSILRLFQVSVTFTLSFMFLLPLVSKQRQFPLQYCVDLTGKPTYLYLGVYCFQVLSLSSAGCCTVGVDSVVSSMMSLVAAHFRILGDTMQRVTNIDGITSIETYENYDMEINCKLEKCIEVHVAIIKFAEFIEDIFTYLFLSQFFASGFSLCCMGFLFTLASPGSFDYLLALTFLGSVMLQISIYCIYGNEIILESLKIRDACYMPEWIHCGPNVRRTLFIIMERAKRPTTITAGKFLDLSLVSLVAIIRAALSYIAVLRQLYTK